MMESPPLFTSTPLNTIIQVYNFHQPILFYPTTQPTAVVFLGLAEQPLAILCPLFGEINIKDRAEFFALLVLINVTTHSLSAVRVCAPSLIEYKLNELKKKAQTGNYTAEKAVS